MKAKGREEDCRRGNGGKKGTSAGKRGGKVVAEPTRKREGEGRGKRGELSCIVLMNERVFLYQIEGRGHDRSNFEKRE